MSSSGVATGHLPQSLSGLGMGIDEITIITNLPSLM